MLAQMYFSMIECPKHDWHAAFGHKRLCNRPHAAGSFILNLLYIVIFRNLLIILHGLWIFEWHNGFFDSWSTIIWIYISNLKKSLLWEPWRKRIRNWFDAQMQKFNQSSNIINQKIHRFSLNVEKLRQFFAKNLNR